MTAKELKDFLSKFEDGAEVYIHTMGIDNHWDTFPIQSIEIKEGEIYLKDFTRIHND